MDYEVSGLFWDFQKPDKKYHGKYVFSYEKGGRLSVDGLFLPDELEFIHGQGKDGEQITLTNCFTTNQRISWTGNHSSEIFSHFGFIGAHFSEIPKFSSVYISFENFYNWVGISGVKQEIEPNTISLNYQRPKPIVISEDDAQLTSIGFTYNNKRSVDNNKFEFTEDAYLDVHFKENEKDLTFILSLIKTWQDFLSLGVASSIAPTNIQGKSGLLNGDMEHRPDSVITILYQPIGKNSNKAIYPNKMNFDFAHIKDKFSDLLKLWFDLRSNYREVIDLYFWVIHNQFLDNQTKFLYLIKAIEVYQRLRNAKDITSNEMHNKKIEIILDSCPTQYKCWLTNKLEYSNETTLRKSLKLLCDESKTLLGNMIKKKAFVNLAYVSRNYYTHFNKTLEHRAAKGLKLYIMNLELMTLIEFIFFKELKFDDNDIKEMMDRANLLNRYRRGQNPLTSMKKHFLKGS